MILFDRHEARSVPTALALRFQPPQLPADAGAYLAVFDQLAGQGGAGGEPFTLLVDLRGFRLDHAGEVAQNRVAKATRAAIAGRMRALVLVTETPTDRKRSAFAQFWSTQVLVCDDPIQAETAFWSLHDQLVPTRTAG